MSSIADRLETEPALPEEFEGFNKLIAKYPESPDNEKFSAAIEAAAMDPAAAQELITDLENTEYDAEDEATLEQLRTSLSERVEQLKLSAELSQIAEANRQTEMPSPVAEANIAHKDARVGNAREALLRVVGEGALDQPATSERPTDEQLLNERYDLLLKDVMANVGRASADNGYSQKVRGENRTWIEDTLSAQLQKLPEGSDLTDSVAAVLGTRDGLDVVLAEATGHVRSLDEILRMPFSDYAKMVGVELTAEQQARLKRAS